MNAQVQLTEEQKAALAAKTQKTVDELRYVLLDSDRNGWTDPWEKAYPAHAKDQNGDPDGDGISNWDELLDGTDPSRANKKGEIYYSPEELAKQAADAARAKIAMEDAMAQAKAQISEFEGRSLEKADGSPASMQDFIEAKREESRQLGMALGAKTIATDRKAKDLQRRLGIQQRYEDSAGRVFGVVGVEGEVPTIFVTNNIPAADTISTDEIRTGGSLGLSLSGVGTKIGLWDGGDVYNAHYEFSYLGQRVTDKDGTQGIVGHSTHVAGTLAASGVLTSGGVPVLKGMSTGAEVHSYDFTGDTSEMATAASVDDLRVSNHSYSAQRGWGTVAIGGTAYLTWWGDTLIDNQQDSRFGFYDSEYTRPIDQVAYSAPWYLPVWSAANERGSDGAAPASQPVFHYMRSGNVLVTSSTQTHPTDGDSAGYDTLSNQGVAKNVLTVTAVSGITGGYVNSSQVAVASFSSFGPVDDGRIKPDLSACGVSVWSTWPYDSGGYLSLTGNAFLSGTSMAAPTVTGSLNLLIEHYKNLFGSTQYLLSSTVKGLAVHTADEAGTTTGPDYIYGWGLMNAKKAAQLLSADAAAIGALPFVKQVYLGSSDYISFPVTAVGGSTPLKVTLCWTDPAGPVMSNAVDANVASLVNDLDLRITKDATTHYPWKLNPASPTAAATNSGDNNRDNVEQVLVSSPTAAATYTVSVTHKGNLVDQNNAVTGQNVSIIISGNQADAVPPFEVTSFTQTGSNEHGVVWPSIVGGVYRIQTTTDLVSWTDSTGDISATKTTTSKIQTHTSGETRRFYRVKRLR